MKQDEFLIGERLPSYLQRLSEVLEVVFSIAEIDRVFKDAEADQVSSKSYCFYDSKKLRVTGVVDEYEPETLWINVRGPVSREKAFERFIDECRLLLGPKGSIH